MNPPHTLRHVVRTALVVLTALFAVLLAANPASAATYFSASDLGEDNCTYFVAEGTADWNIMGIPEQAPVLLAGKTYTESHGGGFCLTVIPKDRHVEFVGYDYEGKPIAELTVPISTEPGGAEFKEYLMGEYGSHSINYLTATVCVTQPDIGWGARDCGETRIVTPSGFTHG